MARNYETDNALTPGQRETAREVLEDYNLDPAAIAVFWRRMHERAMDTSRACASKAHAYFAAYVIAQSLAEDGHGS